MMPVFSTFDFISRVEGRQLARSVCEKVVSSHVKPFSDEKQQYNSSVP